MRTLGLLFIGFGVLLCLTVILAHLGLVSIGVGALLCMAGQPDPRATFEVTPGVGRRLLLAGVIGIALLGLVALASRYGPGHATAAVTSSSTTAPASSPSAATHAKARKVSPGR